MSENDTKKIVTHNLSAEYVDGKFIKITVSAVDGKQYHFEYSVPENTRYSKDVKFRKKGIKQFEQSLQELIEDALALDFCNAHLIAGSLRSMAFCFKFDVRLHNDKVIFFEAPEFEVTDPDQLKMLAENPGKKLLWAQFVD